MDITFMARMAPPRITEIGVCIPVEGKRFDVAKYLRLPRPVLLVHRFAERTMVEV